MYCATKKDYFINLRRRMRCKLNLSAKTCVNVICFKFLVFRCLWQQARDGMWATLYINVTAESVHCGAVNRPCKWRNCITNVNIQNFENVQILFSLMWSLFSINFLKRFYNVFSKKTLSPIFVTIKRINKIFSSKNILIDLINFQYISLIIFNKQRWKIVYFLVQIGFVRL